MSLGPAYGGAGGDDALPYIELHQTATDDIVFTNVFATWEWTSVAFDTSDGSLWTYGTDVLTIDKTGTYRIDFHPICNTVDVSRIVTTFEKDPLGVGSFAFMPGSSAFFDSTGSATSAYVSLTVSLTATDKIRVVVRRLSGTAPSSTEGGNGPMWRITKMD